MWNGCRLARRARRWGGLFVLTLASLPFASCSEDFHEPPKGADVDANLCAGVDCSSLDDDCNVGSCNPVDGSCQSSPIEDGEPCSLGHCNAGVCTQLQCATGTADCDGVKANGCEVTLTTNPDHCGSCKHACAVLPNSTASCSASLCETSCNPGFGDCNKVASGCETDLTGNLKHCGKCNSTCPAGNTCESSQCYPLLRWSRTFGGSKPDGANAIAFDAAGNVYVVGKFTGPTGFGGSIFATGGIFDAFVASFDGITGAHRWSRQLGGGGEDEGMSVAVDGAGNVYVSGSFTGTANFGGGGVTSNSQKDAFLASYDAANGTYRWSKVWGGTGDDIAWFVATDVAGNVYVTGEFATTANLGDGNVTSLGDADIFVASYQGTNGAYRWARNFGTTGEDVGISLVSDGTGHVFVTGYFSDSLDLGGTPLQSNGGTDVFLARLNATTGAHVWSKHVGGTLNDRPWSVASDTTGNAYLTGLFQGSADFGAGSVMSGGSYDGFLASYSSTGTHRWSRTSGAIQMDEVRSVAVDTTGNVFVTGYFGGTADFGTMPLISAGSTDLFVASYSGATGTARWSHRIGGTAGDGANGIAVSGTGGVGIAGSFVGAVNFGKGEVSSVGEQDIHVVVFDD